MLDIRKKLNILIIYFYKKIIFRNYAVKHTIIDIITW